jgi:hypothetical protein
MDYVENNTILSMDLMRINIAWVPFLPKLSRLIFKSSPLF